jgi:pentatricopeptide repeat protein
MMHLSSDRDVVACTALVNMYGNCGDVGCARHAFDVMVNRNVISWNAMIKAYAVNGHGCVALGVYDRMLMEGMAPNNVTLICVIDACECFRALSKGKSVHACIGFVPEHKADVVISNALINLYGKCGDIVDAVKAFSRMQTHNLSSWNSIISIHGQHGDGERAVSLFASMCKERVRPDQITYFGLLSACSHSGLVEEGFHYFTTMRNTADVPITVEHYNCIIDLLGRAGWLDCIEDLIVRYMSVTPDVKSWVTLLGACRIHSDVARMERIVEYMFHDVELENPTPDDALLANMYTTGSGMLESPISVNRSIKR